MAENKKSFILYSDLLKSIEHLTNEEKGILFNHLLLYVNDQNPILEDRLVLTAWKPIELQLKRDLIKFEEVRGKRSDAGKESARLRALKSVEQDTTNSTSVKSVKQRSTNSTDSVNDNVNVNDNEIKKNYFEHFWNLYDKKVERKSCYNKFIKLDLEVIEKIINVVPFYVKSTPEVKYRKNPETWINGECWNDEIKDSTTEQPKERFTPSGQKLIIPY
jgi:retron-type reverse transcriptase